MKKIIIITSNALRHTYFKTLLSNAYNIDVIKTYVEGEDAGLSLHRDEQKYAGLEQQHYRERHNTENDFFSDVTDWLLDKSKSVYIKRGSINEISYTDEIIHLNPDLIITYGCSIIKPRLIEIFKKKIINVHLGLSPYYRGAGTNLHAMINKDFHLCGYTLMYIDRGIDTGQVIHQARAKIGYFDNPHIVGNRIIKNMTRDLISLIQKFHLIKEKEPLRNINQKVYKQKDATPEALNKLYQSFSYENLLQHSIDEERLCLEFPIIEQSFLKV